MDGGLTSGCPTAARAVPTRAGLLQRVLVPGGRLAAKSLARFAAGCVRLGLDRIEITNRANLQIRTQSQQQADAVARLATDCALLPRAHSVRRRAIVLSPLAGFDASETADPISLMARLDEAMLSSPPSQAISPKFGVGIDAGGAYSVLRSSLDLVFEANGADRWRIIFAGRDAKLEVSTASAPAILVALVELLLAEAAARVKDVVALKGIATIQEALERAGATRAWNALRGPRESGVPIGILSTSVADRSALGAVVPFGVLDLQAALIAAEVGDRYGIGEVRLTCRGGILVPGISHVARDEARARLQAAGLSTDPRTPWASIHACVGVEGCLRADMDVRSTARAVAAALGPAARRGQHIHVSGCARGCAWPRRADLLLLADGRGGFDLRRDADARVPTKGVDLARGVSPDRAPAAIQALVLDLAEPAAERD
jgi:precorrin-3B synthase